MKIPRTGTVPMTLPAKPGHYFRQARHYPSAMLASDPEACRVGAAFRSHTGSFLREPALAAEAHAGRQNCQDPAARTALFALIPRPLRPPQPKETWQSTHPQIAILKLRVEIGKAQPVWLSLSRLRISHKSQETLTSLRCRWGNRKIGYPASPLVSYSYGQTPWGSGRAATQNRPR